MNNIEKNRRILTIVSEEEVGAGSAPAIKQNEVPDQPVNEDQPVEAADQTNSDEAARKRGEFIAQKIKEQAQASISIESQDKAICRIVNSWASKPTDEAEKFLKKGYTKYRYIGRKLGQAAVPYDRGLDFLKSKYPDEDPKHLEEEYTWGYGEVDYDEKFRKYITKS